MLECSDIRFDAPQFRPIVIVGLFDGCDHVFTQAARGLLGSLQPVFGAATSKGRTDWPDGLP